MKQFGFSLIEVLIVGAILVIILKIVFNPFTAFRNQQALKGAVEEVLSTLQQARGQTIASTGDSQYGVHLAGTQVVLFTGSVYNAGSATNYVTTLSSLVNLGNISLAGGGSDIIFQRLTGATSQTGSLVISLKSDASQTKTISINSNGVSDVN
ncbi:MAG: prepilin-type N-terminal cleavage/methylation domain-containing protein [Candidatus Vogelbacteria bacterium]|nr:prepilin-type N-terminal cleavage/methylation domain-containing protein [Candidatus Vogelbacteria bacterium]